MTSSPSVVRSARAEPPIADLFDWRPPPPKPPYPETPGHRWVDTSREAAEAMEPRAPTLRDRCLDLIEERGGTGATADEIANALGESVLAVRPRISELKKMGLVRDGGKRRRNASGLNAAVMVAVSREARG